MKNIITNHEEALHKLMLKGFTKTEVLFDNTVPDDVEIVRHINIVRQHYHITLLRSTSD